MFGIGPRELLIVTVILVLVFGLPFWLRAGRRAWHELRRKLDLD